MILKWTVKFFDWFVTMVTKKADAMTDEILEQVEEFGEEAKAKVLNQAKKLDQELNRLATTVNEVRSYVK